MSDILDDQRCIPPLPHTALRLAAMVGDPAASAMDIERIARTDEALSMTILRWANSARFGRPGQAFTLKESIIRLGTASLLEILLQQQAAGIFVRADEGCGMQRGAMWRGAIGGALGAELLARDSGFPHPDLAFLCALLRDIGRVAMVGHMGGEYMNQVNRVAKPNLTLVSAEQAAFGFDHAQLGGELARRWGLPDRISRVIGLHHVPPADPPAHDVLIDLVHAADLIALWSGLGVGFEGMRYALAEHVRLGLSIDRMCVEHLIVRVWDGLRESEAIAGQSAPRRAVA